jgi:hypothetical protein
MDAAEKRLLSVQQNRVLFRRWFLPKFLEISQVVKVSWPVLFSWSPSTGNSQWILLV